jgi:hypothetical protein
MLAGGLAGIQAALLSQLQRRDAGGWLRRRASHAIVPGRAGWPPPKLKRPAARSCGTRSRSPAAAITPGAMACATA